MFEPSPPSPPLAALAPRGRQGLPGEAMEGHRGIPKKHHAEAQSVGVPFRVDIQAGLDYKGSEQQIQFCSL